MAFSNDNGSSSPHSTANTGDQIPGLGKAEHKALSTAADKVQRTMRAIALFTGRQIAAAFTTDENGLFKWSATSAGRAVQAAIDARKVHGAILESFRGRDGRSTAGCRCNKVLLLPGTGVECLLRKPMQ